MHTPHKSLKPVDSGFSRAAMLRSGLIAGLGVGMLVGGTIWTHTPDLGHAVIALVLMLVCAVLGTLIGMLVSVAPADTALDTAAVGADGTSEAQQRGEGAGYSPEQND